MLNQSKNDLTNRGRVGTGGGGSYGLIDLFFGERLPGLLYCLSSRSLHLPQAKDNLRDLSHGNTERERERETGNKDAVTLHMLDSLQGADWPSGIPGESLVGRRGWDGPKYRHTSITNRPTLLHRRHLQLFSLLLRTRIISSINYKT